MRNTLAQAENPRRSYAIKPQEDDSINFDDDHEYDQVFLSRETIKLTSSRKAQNNRENVAMLKETL